ncbi:TAP-like protein-domain-containing protein [Massariosphaeria phaeospora]|uniref:TAP-like protein-domain-containing protein n=1 Tax=Massariosphaeria phaeospora TaxID=100035 RepID=A0A7C8MAR1_9PLEO|nr:TAP-like protein-domain-containing protein [Massariosphaeria phaeospora]
MDRIIFLVLFAATTSARPWISQRQDNTSTAAISDFADITPSADINWVPCFETFECTYLTVPLDYEEPAAGTTNVAYVKLSSGNPTAQDILVNPGGPGSSGVGYVIESGPKILKLLNGAYNIIGFDPRGVNNTGPTLSCAPTPEMRALYKAPSVEAPLAIHYSNSKSLGQFCTQVNANNDTKYAGTVASVQDMVHFTTLQAAANGNSNPEAEPIWYYGVSYGTVIGQTLAALFPHRLGRVILDANVYGVEHYTGYAPSAIEDTDKTFSTFFQYCFEAGVELCPYAGTSTSAADIEERFRALLQALEDEPLPNPLSVGIVGRSELELRGFMTMYKPIPRFYTLGLELAALERGNVTEYAMVQQVSAQPGGAIASNPEYAGLGEIEAQKLITAIDASDRYAITSLAEYKEVHATLKSASQYGGHGIAVENTLFANGMGIMPPESQRFPGFKHVNCSAPILFIGTAADPITPISSAHKMAQYFAGSVVLSQNSPGHSFQSIDSKCMLGYVATYLADGTLPDAGTVCEVDLTPAEVFEKGKEEVGKLLAGAEKM